MENKWIPVTNKAGLKAWIEYWITTEDGYVLRCTYGLIGWVSIDSKIIAYKPIEKPEPYKPPKEFKMGDKVREIGVSYRDNLILVTGEGKDNKPGLFSGTVIQHDSYVGFHSDIWDVKDFEKI